MKVWWCVEGESDKLSLQALFGDWLTKLRPVQWSFAYVPYGSKAKLLNDIGPRAARLLTDSEHDLVIALPDLYPMAVFRGSANSHTDLHSLQAILNKKVESALCTIYGHTPAQASRLVLNRFVPSALKYDLEVLLLANTDGLRARLRTKDRLGSWRVPPEDQNDGNPPKYVVGDLFRTRLKREYRETFDAPWILSQAGALHRILTKASGQSQCPEFERLIDLVSTKTGVVP